MQTFEPNFVIVAMLKGAIDFCHFVYRSLVFDLAGCHKVSAKQNLLASFSHTLLD